jgi:8-oxo-dGTP pyrophosphatase MutT (NUDIX family)
MTGPEPITRRAARVLLIDGAARVLLLHGFDPANPTVRYWFTVGGGLDRGETPAQGAARELFEETGLRATPADFGEPVWHDVTEFPFEGRRYRQEQDYFLLHVDSWAVDHTNFDDVERRSVDAHRWWSVDELATTSQRFYPVQLPELLTQLLSQETPC